MTSAPHLPDESPAPRRRRVPRWPLVVLALLIALRVALPAGLRETLERLGSDALGKSLQVESVDVGLLRGRVELRDARIAGDGPGEPPLASVGRLAVDLGWRDLVRGALTLDALELADVRARLQRDAEGRLEPIVLATPGAAAGAREDEPEPGAAPSLRVSKLRLERVAVDVLAADGSVELDADVDALAIGVIRLEDGALAIGPVAVRGPLLRVRRPAPAAVGGEAAPAPPADADTSAPGTGASALPWEIASLEIDGGAVELFDADRTFAVQLRARATDVSPRAQRRFPVDVELRLAGGELALRGELGLAPVSWQGALTWSELRLDALVDLLDAPPLQIDGGVARADLRLELDSAPDAPRRLSLAGALGLRDLDAGALDGALDLALGALDVEIARVDVPLDGSAPDVHLARVALDAPRVALRREAAAAAADATPREDHAPRAAAPPRVRVDELVLGDGALALDDRTLDPPHTTRVEGLELRAREIAWPQTRLRDAVLEASLASGQLSASGALGSEGDRLEASLERLGLRHLSPYTGGLGYEILGGSAALSAALTTREQGFAADGELTLEGLDLAAQGNLFQETFGIPVGLAIALLRDPAGRIRLRVPVEIGGEGSGVDVAGALRSALRQSIVGALSSPLKALGALAEGAGGLVGLRAPTLAFEPGSPEPAADAVARLEELARLMEERPELAVELHGSTGDVDAASGGEPVSPLLAEARAAALRARLLEQHGIAAARVRIGPPEHRGAHVRAELGTFDASDARTSPTPAPPADRSAPGAS